MPTPLPTVEQTLWEALSKGRLVDSSKSFDSAGWSRCGRTDKGVSSAGQVVALWVRSAYSTQSKPHGIGAFKEATTSKPVTLNKVQQAAIDNAEEGARAGVRQRVEQEALTTHIQKQSKYTPELNYIQILNSLLPPSIRVLGWSPVKAKFDARFDCQRRHYKYYFDTAPSALGPGLDLGLVNEALQHLQGTHDFRNFCKVDASKQIKNFQRTIMDAWIDTPSEGSLHCVNLVGSAFLYHQVRCIMAVLFLVGCGRERVGVIDDLMRVEYDPLNPSLPAVTGKPIYDMANDLPLCLYDCVFDESAVQWRTVPGDEPQEDEEGREKAQRTNISKSLIDQLYDLELKSAMIRNALAHIQPIHTQPVGERSLAIPLGGNTFAMSSKHLPLLERERGDTPDEINRRWRESEKGKRRQKKNAGGEGEKMDMSDADE